MTAPTLTLRSGAAIPAIGLGTWPMQDADVANAVELALAAGYRLLDTAEAYGNEAGVGEGLRRSGLDRGEVFLTTKFDRHAHSYDGVRRAFEVSTGKLGVDYLDMLMIHWPNPSHGGYLDALRGLEALRGEGLIRAVGVSNFKPAHLQAAFDAGIVPDVNQIKCDPRNPRRAERELHATHGILTEAYTPIGKAGDLFSDPVITTIAADTGRTPAQVVLRWHTQIGTVPIPKSADPGRLAENIAIFDFELTADQLAQINTLDTGDSQVGDSDVIGH